MKKYSIFHIQGGMGKHVAATAVALCIKNNYPDRELIVVCAYPTIMQAAGIADRIYPLGNTKYFYQEYIEGKDSLIFYHEPYYTTNHIHKRKSLIENWCELYRLEYKGEMPTLNYNSLQRKNAENFWKTDKPLMVIHTNGGMMTTDAKPYSWTRDMPFEVAQALADHYNKEYTIIQCTKMNSPKIEGAFPLFATPQQSMDVVEFFSILLSSKARILIDSSLQHAAAALIKPSTVLWNGTSPVVFGYNMHDNILPEVEFKINLPESYLFDFSFEGEEGEYPYGEEENLYDFDKIIESVERTKDEI
jgi:hypothetical protein